MKTSWLERRMKIRMTIVAGVAILGVAFLGTQTWALQLDEDTLDFYAENNIFYYDPSCVESGTDVSVCNANLPAATIEAIESAGVKEKAEENMDRYKYAEEQTGIPWQAIAALHWREAGMASNRSISNGQVLAAAGTCYTNVDGLSICSDPNQDAKEAAEHLISMAKWVYDVELTASSTVDEWGQAFLAYNRGVIYKRAGVDWKESPYPMNGFDEEHALWMERPWVENTAPMYLTGRDLNVGALAIFAYLCGDGSSSGGSSSTSSGSGPLSKDITLIGDSIAVGAGDKLKLKFPNSFFTMVVSRHPTAKGMCDGDEGGLAILGKIVAGAGTTVVQSPSGSCGVVTIDANSLKNNVVWELGTNSVGANETTIRNVVAEVGDRNLFLVTPYDGNNKASSDQIAEMYRTIADQYDNVYIVDWNEEMQSGASTYLSSDRVHPNSAGQDLLVELIAKAVEDAQECVIDTSSSGYTERLKNLSKFNQSYYKRVGTWWNHTMCVSDYPSKKISGHGCGVMSLYAAYYMFTGNNLDDESFFTDLRTAAQSDGYITSECGGTNEEGYGSELEKLTGMKLEKVWGGCGVDCYDDSIHWDMIVSELQKGNKILLGTAGPGVGGSSEFAGNYHATMLDHYDASKDMVYFFDPVYENRHEGIEYADDSSDGAYVSREAMKRYIRPISGYALVYKDNSCYNLCDPVGGNETKPIYPLDEDSIDIACAAGTSDYDTYTNPSWRGKSISIRLCKVDNLTSTGQDDPGYAIVNSRVSGAFHALAARAQSEGVNLIASSSFRTYERQYQFCYTYGWCAIGRAAQPGSSMHELGLAVDFNGTCGFGVSPASCDATGNAISLWLRDNIGDFGLDRPLSNEAWHVQPLPEGDS